ncbi:hypothetical protein BDV93DRAFT_561448 [Ceratobasidium sp. AG-I]|nr:hypothetical protein BDV93DRAFT_561448 [Ceratobasidium sp. AG-I]
MTDVHSHIASPFDIVSSPSIQVFHPLLLTTTTIDTVSILRPWTALLNHAPNVNDSLQHAFVSEPQVDPDSGNEQGANVQVASNPSGNPEVNTDSNIDANDSQHANQKGKQRAKRKTAPTSRGELDAEERAALCKGYKDKQRAKQRKAEAEARGNASQPGPLEPPSKRLKGTRTVDNILNWRLEDLVDDDDKLMWLRQALRKRSDVTNADLKLPLPALMEIWTDVPDAAVVARINNNYQGINVSNEPKPMLSTPTRVKIEGASRNSDPKRQVPSGAKLGATDHTTIGLGGAVPYSQQMRGPNGKQKPIEGAPLATDDERREIQARWGHLSASDFAQMLSSNPTPRHHPFPPSSRPPGPNTLTLVKQPEARRPQSRPSNTQSSNPAAISATRPPVPGKPAARAQPGSDVSRQSLRGNTQARPTPPSGRRSSKLAPRAAPQPGPRGASVCLEQADAGEVEVEVDVANAQTTRDGQKQTAAKETKKSQAQLSKFGVASNKVQLLKERIHLFMLVKCGFADILPYDTFVDPPPYPERKPREGDNAIERRADVERRTFANLLDKWIVQEWAVLHQNHRTKPMPQLEDSYARHIRQQLSRFRNDIKTAIIPLLPLYYKLKHSGFHQSNITRVQELLPNAFHSPNEAYDDDAYHHPIIRDVLRATCFDKESKGLGNKYPHEFKMVPLATIALICSIARHLILEFRTGEHHSTKLSAEEQAPYYQMYLNDLLYIRHPSRGKNRIRKLQRQLYMECSKPTTTPAAMLIEREVREWGPDSEDSEPEGYQDFEPPARDETPFSPPQSAPLTPTSAALSPCALPRAASSSPVAGPSQPRIAQRNPTPDINLTLVPPSSPTIEYDPAEKVADGMIDDAYGNLTAEDEATYYGEEDETMKDD